MMSIDKVALIYIKQRKVLSTRSRGKDAWYLPGGKREGTETDEECLTREIKEELNVDLTVGSLIPMGVFEAQAHGKAEGVVVQMTCYSAEFDGVPTATSEIEDIAWLDSSVDLASLSPVDQIIFAHLNDHNLIS